jgi:hypothetical protein
MGVDRERELEIRNQELERRVEALQAELHGIRRAEDRALSDLDPVGNMVTRGDIEDAQQRMIDQVERPMAENPQPPRPERLSAAERERAQQEIDRQNAARPRDSELDWLRASTREAGAGKGAPRDVDLDWLRERGVVDDRDVDRDRERDR